MIVSAWWAARSSAAPFDRRQSWPAAARDDGAAADGAEPWAGV